MQASTRRLMTTVAIVAVIVWSVTVAMRWAEYRRLAIKHEQVCEILNDEIDSLTEQSRQPCPKGALAGQNLSTNVRARKDALNIEEQLAQKYRQAMKQPWRTAPKVEFGR